MGELVTIGFFNNKGGVGKTSLAFHLGWMFYMLGHRTLMVDLDPQSNLSAFALPEEKIQDLWDKESTINGALAPLFEGTGDIGDIHVEEIHVERSILGEDYPNSATLGLLLGSLGLAAREDDISQSWPKCNDGDERAFRVISAFARLIAKAAKQFEAGVALVDIGPNTGAINRSALIACDFVIIPIAPDLFSLQGLRHVGPTLYNWRKDWDRRLKSKPSKLADVLPRGKMQPLGYVTSRFSTWLKKPAQAFKYWDSQIPAVYNEYVLGLKKDKSEVPPDSRLAVLKDYRSTMSRAQEQKRPIFLLPPRGNLGGQKKKDIADCHGDFKNLALAAWEKITQAE